MRFKEITFDYDVIMTSLTVKEIINRVKFGVCTPDSSEELRHTNRLIGTQAELPFIHKISMYLILVVCF